MSTHSTLSVRFPDGSISGCYVHHDGDSMKGRIRSFLEEKTTTCLAVLIAEAQGRGGMRSFHCPESWNCSKRVTELMDDDDPYVIDEENWDDHHGGAQYRYTVDYETADVESIVWSNGYHKWVPAREEMI
ncbi:MAG TPA: hypothetical protein EYG51_22205 [Pseudomonadales bacterium]|nr:hypothetical protein [Pseudomonadales bacterium]